MSFFHRLRTKKALFLLAVIALVIFLVVRNFTAAPAKETTYTVSRQDLKETLSLSGKIAAEQDEVLTFQTGGQLAWVGVKVGDQVKKYQGIASLDQRSVQKNLQKKLNDYLTNRWTFEQTKDNYKDTAVTTAIQRLVDQSQFSLNNTVLDVELSDLTRQFSNLWAPFDGIVIRADAVSSGLNVTPLVTGYEIVNPDSIYFSATADQADVINLSVSAAGEITFDPYPDQPVTGTITNIAYAPKSDETGTVYEVKIQFADKSFPKYRLGMTGDVDFVVREKPGAISVPEKYLKKDGDKQYVLVKVNNKKVKRYVTTGATFDTDVEIVSGLDEGSVIYQN